MSFVATVYSIHIGMSIESIITIGHVCPIAVNGQKCGGTTAVGSLAHGRKIVQENQTFILAGYTVPCNATVVAWEFCYQTKDATPVTFYPGIWRTNTSTNGSTDFKLVQSNNVTFTPNGNSGNTCQIFNVSTTDQFTAPAGSVVGLYSNTDRKRPLLLRNDSNVSVIAYKVKMKGNYTDVRHSGVMKVDYNIAIKVYLSK